MNNNEDYKKYRKRVAGVGYCYDMADLNKFLTKKELERFNKWFSGQTGCIGDNGEFLVYEWDIERFIDQIGRK